MSNNASSRHRHPRPSYVRIALLAACLEAGGLLLDNFISHHVIVFHSDDPIEKLAGSFVFLVVGYSMMALWAYAQCAITLRRVGASLYIERKVVRWPSAHTERRAKPFAIAAGLISGVATTIYLWANRNFDPSLVMALTSISLIYSLALESIPNSCLPAWLRKTVPTSMNARTLIMPAIIIIIGTMFVAVDSDKDSVETSGHIIDINITAMLLVGGIHQVCSAVSKVLTKAGMDVQRDRQEDSISNISALWKTVASTLLSIVIGIGFAFYFRQWQTIWLILSAPLIVAGLALIGVRMGMAAKAVKWTNDAYQLAQSATEVSMFSSAEIIFVVVVNYVVAQLGLSWFGSLTTAVYVWGAKAIGALTIFATIVWLRGRAREA